MAMHPGMKMLMMERVRQQPQDNYSRSEYGGGRRMIGYDREMNGNASTTYGGYGEGPEARRRRDSRGRYMTGRIEDDDDEMRGQVWHPPYGGTHPPSMHGGSRYGFGDVYAEIHAPGAMNRPGMMGGMDSDMNRPVDEHTARMWVENMDGGEKFKVEQTDQQRSSICPSCGKWEFYTAMNAMYSDYCETAKKMGVDKIDFYAHLAKDFLMDSDAKPHKLRRYMEHIAR